MNARRPVIFTHIPKAGGTTLRELLYQAAVEAGVDAQRIHVPGFGGVGFASNTMDLAEPDLDALRSRNLLLLADHGAFGVHERLGMPDPFYFTMLRDPEDSFVSSFYFLMREVLVERSALHCAEFVSYFGQPALEALVAVGRIPHINEFPKEHLARLAYEYRNPVLLFLGLPETPVGVATAQRRLREEYHFFGLLERFESSVAMLRKVLPAWIRLAEFVPRRNTGSKRPGALDDGVRELIAESRGLDAEIYSYARRIFETAHPA